MLWAWCWTVTNSNGASRLAHVDGALPLIAETESVDLACFCPDADKAGSLFTASNSVDGDGIPRTFAPWRCRRLDCKEVEKISWESQSLPWRCRWLECKEVDDSSSSSSPWETWSLRVSNIPKRWCCRKFGWAEASWDSSSSSLWEESTLLDCASARIAINRCAMPELLYSKCLGGAWLLLLAGLGRSPGWGSLWCAPT